MTEAQRIGQLFILGLTRDRLDATERRAIAEFHFDPQRVEKQGRRGPCVTTLPSRSSEEMEVGDPGP